MIKDMRKSTPCAVEGEVFAGRIIPAEMIPAEMTKIWREIQADPLPAEMLGPLPVEMLELTRAALAEAKRANALTERAYEVIASYRPIVGMTPRPATQRRKQRSPQLELAKRMIAKLYPNGVPDTDAIQTVTSKIAAASLELEGIRRPPSWRTVARALKRRH